MRKSSVCFVILLAALLNACTAREAGPRQFHEAKTETLQPQKTVALDESTKALESFDFPKMDQALKGSDEELRSKIIDPLSKYLLDPSYLRSSNFSKSDKSKTALSYFNSALRKLIQSKSQNVETYLTKYREVLLSGCQAGTLEKCEFLTFFSKDNGTAFFAKVFAHQEKSDVRKKFLYMLLSFEISNRTKDDELSLMVVENGSALLKSYSKVIDNKTQVLVIDQLSEEDRAALRRYVDIIQISLPEVIEKGHSDKVLAMAGEFYPLIRTNQLKQMVDHKFHQVMVDLVVKNIREPHLWAAFGTDLRLREKEEGSYSKVLSELKTKFPKLVDGLKIECLELFDPKFSVDDKLYFTVADLIYRQATPEEVMAFWRASSRDFERFMTIVENYLKIFLAQKAIFSSHKLSQFFRKFEATGNATHELIDLMITEAQEEVAPTWSEFFRGTRFLQTFFTEQIQREIKAGSAASVHADRLRRFFNEVNRNVKYLVVYPNMLMFAYYASKFDFTESFDFFGAKIKINSRLILNEMMQGQIDPFFNFTDGLDNKKSLNQVEMTYALYYAIQMDIFELYQIDPVKWFQQLYVSYVQDDVEKVRKLYKTVFEMTMPGSDYESAVTICDDIKAGRPVFSSTRRHLDSFRFSLFSGYRWNASTPRPFTSFSELMGTKFRMADWLEIVRSDIDPKLRRLFLIKAMLQKVPSTLTSAAEIEKGIDSILSPLLTARSSFLNAVDRVTQDVAGCMMKLSEDERERKRDVFRMELEHARHITLALAALKDFQEKNMDQLPVAELKKVAHPIWQESFFDNLNDKSDLLTAINELILQTINYNRAFASNPEYRDDYSAFGGIRREGSQFIYYLRVHDTLVRLYSFYENGYNGKRVARKTEETDVIFPTTMRGYQAYFHQNPSTKIVAQSLSLPSTKDLAAATLNIQREFAAQIKGDKFGWFFDVSHMAHASRILIQSLVSAHKMKAESELDPVAFSQCTGECKEKDKKTLVQQSFALLEKNLEVFKYHVFDAVDREFLERYFLFPSYFASSAESTFPIGAINLFVDLSQKEYVSFAEEMYVDLISFHLGRYPKRRLFRNGDKQAGESGDDLSNMTPGAGTVGKTVEAEQLLNRENFFETAPVYYKTFREQKLHGMMFPISEEVKTYVWNMFAMPLRREVELERAFIIAHKKFQQEVQIPPLQSTLRFPPHPAPFRLDVKGYYEFDLKEFDKATEGLFDLSSIQ